MLRLILKKYVNKFNLMNIDNIHQPTNFSINTLKKIKNNVSGTTDCSGNIIPKPPRFADEFIKLSSVRYKPEKIYTKQCPDSIPLCERTQCQSSNTTTKCPYM